MPLPRTATVTVETLKQDLPNVVGFLRALETVAPGRVPEELLAELEHAQRSALTLDLLCRAMGGK